MCQLIRRLPREAIESRHEHTEPNDWFDEKYDHTTMPTAQQIAEAFDDEPKMPPACKCYGSGCYNCR